MFGVLGSLTGNQDGGAKKKAPPKKKAASKKDNIRGDRKNGSGRAFLAYEKLTLDELQKKAKARGIKFAGMKKAELIALLRK